jgi:hypothetical protein
MNPFKYILCCLLCPEFKARIPEKKPGKFVAEVYTKSIFGNYCAKYSGEFNCRRKAYYAARWEALKLDLNMPNYEGVEIRWRVINKNET